MYIFLALLCIDVSSIFALDINFSWTPPPSSNIISGYKVYWGSSSRYYTNNIDLGGPGNLETGIICGLADGQTYYFALTSYNTNDNSFRESEYSKELVWDKDKPQLQTVKTNIYLNASIGSPQALMPALVDFVTNVSDNFSVYTNLLFSQSPDTNSTLTNIITSAVFYVIDEAGNTNSKIFSIICNEDVITRPKKLKNFTGKNNYVQIGYRMLYY